MALLLLLLDVVVRVTSLFVVVRLVVVAILRLLTVDSTISYSSILVSASILLSSPDIVVFANFNGDPFITYCASSDGLMAAEVGVVVVVVVVVVNAGAQDENAATKVDPRSAAVAATATNATVVATDIVLDVEQARLFMLLSA